MVAHQRVLHLNLNLLQSLKVAEDPAGVNERNLGEVWKKERKNIEIYAFMSSGSSQIFVVNNI